MGIGLALAGGGLQGIAHIGAIKALEELGVKIQYISGTSSGSIFASMYAMGFTHEEMREFALKYYKNLIKIKKKTLLKAAYTYLIKKEVLVGGLIDGMKIEQFIQKAADLKNVKNIDEVKIPLALATVDTISTKECILMSKNYNLGSDEIDYLTEISLAKAVRASMSFPGIFTTCNFEKYNFIDGGTKDNLPIKILKDIGAKKTIGISFNMDNYTPRENIFKILLRTIDIFSMKDVRNAQKIADLAIEIDTKGTSLLEIKNIDECIELGYKTIMENKEKILELNNEISLFDKVKEVFAKR